MGIKHKTQLLPANDTPGDTRTGSEVWNESHIWVAEAEPDDSEVAENTALEWLSNGSGYGNAGDLCVKINSAGVIKKATRTPFSILT